MRQNEHNKKNRETLNPGNPCFCSHETVHAQPVD
jgi:hypothetical protein